MDMMKVAAVYASGGAMVIERRPYPAPGPGEITIRVERAGICGSELHAGDAPGRAFPGGFVMGHEFAGVVDRIGKDVTGFAVGDLVGVYPATGCGRCVACKKDVPLLCLRTVRVMGGFAEFACVPAAAALRLPAGLTAADGALIEPLAVGLCGARLARIRPGDRVLVLGAGSVAMATTFWARRLGAGPIAVLSRSKARATMALAMGADAFVPAGEDEAESVARALGGAPDIVLECVGRAGFIMRAAELCRPFGAVISLGLCTAPDPLVPMALGLKALSLRFPTGYSTRDYRHVAASMLSGTIDPRQMITSVVPLDRLPETFALLQGANGETKVHVAPHG